MVEDDKGPGKHHDDAEESIHDHDDRQSKEGSNSKEGSDSHEDSDGASGDKCSHHRPKSDDDDSDSSLSSAPESDAETRMVTN